MAEPTISTSVSHPSISRRSAMICGASALAASALAMPAVAAFGDVDAALRRQIAAADMSLAAYRRADAVSLRLHEEVRRDPEFPKGMPSDRADGARWDAMLERIGAPAADARCERLYERYEAALAAAFSVPARTLAGALGKFRLAVTRIKQEQSDGFDEVDCTYLDNALADLGRLTDGGNPSRVLTPSALS